MSGERKVGSLFPKMAQLPIWRSTLKRRQRNEIDSAPGWPVWRAMAPGHCQVSWFTHWSLSRSLTEPLLILALTSNPRDLWPLRHLITVMRRHHLTQKDLPTYIPTYLHTYPPTYLPACSLTEPLLIFLLPVAGFFLATGASFWIVQCALTIATQDNPADLWHLRHWLQFWQLRTWIHDNLCYLTIKSDGGQHSQFLRCFKMPFSSCFSLLPQCFTICSKAAWQDVWRPPGAATPTINPSFIRRTKLFSLQTCSK